MSSSISPDHVSATSETDDKVNIPIEDSYVLEPPDQDQESDEFEDPVPLVLVEGFMGLNKQQLWGTFSQYLCQGARSRPRQILIVKPGCVSSLHDRACEVYYQLKGGRVDYGEDHSKKYGHDRYGRTYSTGLYPQWSARKPLHFLTHSLGGVTIWKLSQLLQDGFFDASPDSILSLTAVSTPYRGTTSVYILGESTDVPANVAPLSVGWSISRIVHLLEWLDVPSLKDCLYDFNADHWKLSRKLKEGRSLIDCMKKSPWAEGKDCAPYDLTIHSMLELNKHARVHDKTFYRSYTTSMTRKDKNGLTHSPTFSLSTASLWHLARSVGHFKFPQKVDKQKTETQDVPTSILSTLNPEDWYENDGIVCTYSQAHPFDCRHVSCSHYNGLPSLSIDGKDTRDATSSHHHTIDIEPTRSTLEHPVPGHFEVFDIKDTTHFQLCPLWYGTELQKRFWVGVGEYLAAIEDVWLASTQEKMEA